VEEIAGRLEAGGRWVNVGAGTSGRLGVLDASELPPTFGIPLSLVHGRIAGGRAALVDAVEGAEDDEAAGAAEIRAERLGPKDVVLGIAASGATPWVAGALGAAKEAGALAIALACAPGSRIAALADLAIVVETGPEVLRGSTRMKAGTAQKLVLNMLSTAVFARLGLVWRGEMVAMRPTNAKLRQRAVDILRRTLGIAEEEARSLLSETGWELPPALVAARWRVSPTRASEWIAACRGNVARALEEEPS